MWNRTIPSGEIDLLLTNGKKFFRVRVKRPEEASFTNVSDVAGGDWVERAGTKQGRGSGGSGGDTDGYECVLQEAAHAHEQELLAYATARLSDIRGVRIIGTAREKASVLAFVIEDVHPHDVGTILDQEGIAIRAGHHCAQPVMQHFGVPATARASFAFYNTKDEVDQLVAAVQKVIEVFA